MLALRSGTGTAREEEVMDAGRAACENAVGLGERGRARGWSRTRQLDPKTVSLTKTQQPASDSHQPSTHTISDSTYRVSTTNGASRGGNTLAARLSRTRAVALGSPPLGQTWSPTISATVESAIENPHQYRTPPRGRVFDMSDLDDCRSIARVYADANESFGRQWWDYGKRTKLEPLQVMNELAD